MCKVAPLRILLQGQAVCLYFYWQGTSIVFFGSSRSFCPCIQIQVLPEGGETPIFKQFFKSWKEKDQAEGLGRVFVTERIAKIQQSEFDASKLHESQQMAAQYNMVDDGTGKTQVTICIQKIRDWSEIVLVLVADEHLAVKMTLKMKREAKSLIRLWTTIALKRCGHTFSEFSQAKSSNKGICLRAKAEKCFV